VLFRTSKYLDFRSQSLQVFVAYMIEALTYCKVSTAQLSDTASLGSLASSDGQLAHSELCSKPLLLIAFPHSPTHVNITPEPRNCHTRSPASQSYIACSILYLLCTLKSSLVTILTLNNSITLWEYQDLLVPQNQRSWVQQLQEKYITCNIMFLHK
jgi:hypothetical protein